MSTRNTGEFVKVAKIELYCDECEDKLGDAYLTYDYKWNDGYDYYGDIVDFCSVGCFYSWMVTHIIEYGVNGVLPVGERVSLHGDAEIMRKLMNLAIGE
jgi:hypothetical protein